MFFRAFFLTKILKKISLILCVHRADTPINMLYNAQDELDEWKVQMQLKESYGWDDDDKEWLATLKVHHKKWNKKIKQQAGKAARSGRGGGGSGKKMQFSWKHVAEISGKELTLGGVWTQERAALHFSPVYKFENDTPRSGNVSRDSEVYKCRKYIADADGHPRIYIRVVEIEEGTEYTIEQGYPIGDNVDDDDDDDPGSGPASEEVPGAEEEEEQRPQPPKGRKQKAAGAPAPAPAAPEPTESKKRRKKAA